MRIISYRDLAPGQFAKPIEKISAALTRGDFAAAGLKKLSPTPYWRAKLNDEARLLMQFAPHRGETVCLFLEVITNHAYEKSRFLRGAAIDRSKIESGPDDAAPQPEPSVRGGLAVVESDVRHPLLGLLGLEEVAEIATGPVQPSTKDEWAQEARKLELQGKQEQAQSIRQTFLASRPTPWTPWSLTALGEWAPKALDPRNPSAKIKQNMFDYALWHGQGAYIEKLAQEAKFAAALPLTHEGDLLGRFEGTLYGRRFVNPSKNDRFADDPKNPMGRATRAVAAMRERLLRPYLERSPKSILQDCGLYGVDHRTYCGATPLMLAARSGNVALVEQLLDRGADEDLVDDYGHTAWMGALNRAIDDHAFGKAHLGELFERLGPDTLDVHADGRLVRLERGQGEFWLLGLMLAGLKTHAGGLFARPLGPQRHMRGFFSDSLLRTLELLPEHLWPKSRRKSPRAKGVRKFPPWESPRESAHGAFGIIREIERM